MKREIKFRAWNKKYGLNEPFTLKSVSEFTCKDNGSYTWQPDTVFMQFTGLKDKDGKDIYEGDIIIFGNTEMIVEFESGGFKYFGLEDREQRISIHAGYEATTTVIGNIYENPNLLKP